jgi:hypothetical protein
VSAESAFQRPGLLAAALARVEVWLLEPAPRRAEPQPVEVPPRPVVAVIGLGSRCGATTVARALAVRLAAADPSGAAVVAGCEALSGFAPPGGSASRLAHRLEGSFATAGRLCLSESRDFAALAATTRPLAPLVLDVPRDRSPAAAASLADLTILVASGDGEPALAELACRSLVRPGREPLIVANRVADPSRWSGRAALVLPDSRAGARLAAAGWEARGPLGEAVSRLCDMCEAAA